MTGQPLDCLMLFMIRRVACGEAQCDRLTVRSGDLTVRKLQDPKTLF